MSVRHGSKFFAAWAVAASLALASGSAAEAAIPCGTDYVIQEGDSLAKIANAAYGKSANWTLIYYANQDRLGANATLLVPGLAIRVPCTQAAQPALPSIATATAIVPKSVKTEFSSQIKRIEFLTADDFAPFTTRTLPNGGLITEVINAAMTQLKAESRDAFSFQISWVNDWSAHLDPLLVTRAFDVGFPWAKPDCNDFIALDDNGKLRCRKFFFSDAIAEDPTLVFVRADSPMEFRTDAEMIGKSVCRPAGYFTFDLDHQGRNWVRDNKITLMRPQTINDCVTLLIEGKVDVAALNELPGRSALITLGVESQVKALERPVYIGTMHALVAKTHPNARAIIYYVNSAIRQLRESGEFDRIVERQLQGYYDTLEQQRQPPAAPEVPAAATSDATPPADATVPTAPVADPPSATATVTAPVAD